MMESMPSDSVRSEWDTLRGSLIINDKIVFSKDSDLLTSLDTLCCTRLSPIAARALVTFALHPFEVIRRENLLRMLWGDHGFVVTSNSLNQTVCKLREHFRSIYPDHDLIKTIPRLGYSFVGSVRSDPRSVEQLITLFGGANANASITMVG
ncbi:MULTISPECIES: helix-turn-helix domain-containing protein [unclassified Caballeronia]|uniref:winged helix-turn-helix domain-containing protein n=1 Tax=unclassified Caballeronia TaxID=2646786 RepID=UPI00202890E0|nr:MULTISPECIES: helix-turn-helix domain-containing protein [unclassified Caballeronia]